VYNSARASVHKCVRLLEAVGLNQLEKCRQLITVSSVLCQLSGR
jgi:hypothetical protein